MTQENKQTNVEPLNIRPGQIVVINRKIYGCCINCHSIVRMNKFLFGGFHVCG